MVVVEDMAVLEAVVVCLLTYKENARMLPNLFNVSFVYFFLLTCIMHFYLLTCFAYFCV